MNVGTYLLLTVPLVGGSILLYDTLRASPAAAPETAPISVPAARPEVTAHEGPMLQGDTSGQVERQVREIVERMLAQARSSGGGTTGVTSGSDGNGPLPVEPPIALVGDPESLTGPSAQFDERTLKVFRAYLDESQRLERVERQGQMINGQLDALGVSLSEAQRKSVVDATMKHQNLVRETFRQLPGGADARDARQKAVTDLREAYNKTIFDLVPSAEAEKIVKGMGGGGAWRGDGGAFPNTAGRGRAPAPAGEGR